MTERVRKLRQQSLETVETLSSERAELLTDFYQQENGFLSDPGQAGDGVCLPDGA